MSTHDSSQSFTRSNHQQLVARLHEPIDDYRQWITFNLVPFWLSDGSSDSIAILELDTSTDPPGIQSVTAVERRPFTPAEWKSGDWDRMIEYSLLVDAAGISTLSPTTIREGRVIYADTSHLPESERAEIHKRVYRKRDRIDFDRVAKLYVEGGGADGRGRLAVAEGMNVHPRTASRYITAARNAGAL